MRVYIACALTHVPRDHFNEYVSFVHSLARAIGARECARVTYALLDSDPQLGEKPFDERAKLCYLWDRELIEQADVVVAEASFPSTGMGIELQIAATKGIPVVICFKRDAVRGARPVSYENPDHSRHALEIGEGFVSPMALGIPSLFKTIGYSTDDEGVDAVVDAVNLLKRVVSRGLHY